MKYFIFLILLFYNTNLQSQQLTPEIITTSGDTYQTNNYQLDFTIGETVIDTYSDNDKFLTQGFHQTSVLLVSLIDLNTNFDVSIFPNPTQKNITIQCKENQENIIVELISVDGKILQKGKIPQGTLQHILDLSLLANGNYFIHLKKENNISLKIFKIQKTN